MYIATPIRTFSMTKRERYLLRSMLPALVALTVLVHCHAQNASRQDTVARIADRYSITFPDLQQYVHDYQYGFRYRKHPVTAFEKALEDMIVNQLKRIDFFTLNLNSDPQLLQRIRRSVNEELAIRYYVTQFYGKYVNEGSMRNAYKDMGREVFYQQIVLVKPVKASRKDIDSLKSLAKSIGRKMRNGEDMVRLAKQYSRNRENLPGNTLRHLDWKMSFSDDVAYATFHMPVDDVQVLEGGDSIHVVRVARIRTRNVKPYPNVREEIRQALDGRYAGPSYREFERTKKGFVDEKAVKWNRDALRQLVQWSRIPKFYETVYGDTLREALSHGRNFVIFEYSHTRVDLKEYLRLVSDVLTWGDHVSVSQDDVKTFVVEAVRTGLVVDRAIALGLEKDVFTPGTTNPILKTGIVRLYNRHEIEDRIPPATDKALGDFYRANKDSLYYQLAKVNIYAVVDSNKNVIDGLKAKLHTQVPFEKIAPVILVQTFIRKRDGTLATYLGNEPPFLAEASMNLKLNEVAGPVNYVDPEKGKEYALIKCVHTQEEKQLSYDDVKNRIAEDFSNYHRDRIGESVAARLKSEYSVTIFRDVLLKNLSPLGIKPE